MLDEQDEPMSVYEAKDSDIDVIIRYALENRPLPHGRGSLGRGRTCSLMGAGRWVMMCPERRHGDRVRDGGAEVSRPDIG